jgi:hypothetical protein
MTEMMQAAGASSTVDEEIVRQMLSYLREDLDPRERDRIAALLAAIVNSRMARLPAEPSPVVDSAFAALHAEGYCSFGGLLAPDQVAAVAAHFRQTPCFNAHVAEASDGVGRRLGEGAESFHYGSYRLADVIAAPLLLELANDARLLAIADRYLGCTPTLYSLNAWWSFPGLGRPAKVSQSFHRDLDDFRFCTLFVYLTDVGERGGPHVYVRRTHRIDLLEPSVARADAGALADLDAEMRKALADGALLRGQAYGLDPAIHRLLGELIDVIPGPAGSGLIADTYGLHMGIPPETGPRLIFWARYGTHANGGTHPGAVEERLLAGRLPWNDRSRYINRALFRG